MNLKRSELRAVFSGERHAWSNGVPIRIFVRAPEAPERTALLKLLGMTEIEYKTYWTNEVFRGESQA
jgi:hypothetical protein